MSESQKPVSLPPNERPREPEVRPGSEELAIVSRGEAPREPVFAGAQKLHAFWRLLIYLVGAFCAAYLMLWFGTSFFREPVYGAAVLWQEMYGQAVMAVAAIVPAYLLARIEGRDPDAFGLPRRQAFGKMFWIGSAWGLGSITLLLLALRGLNAFYFGHLALHGIRVLNFAVFWGIYFVLVGLFEEFLMRGYTLYTLTQWIGFWPAAFLLSLAFGAVHYRNPGENWAGLVAAVLIGVFFCLTLQRTGSLWFAVGFHASWDWGQTYLYSVPDSGTMEPGHLMRPSFHGPDWLTGGSVGPEGSVLCFAVIAAASFVFSRNYREVNLGQHIPSAARAGAPAPRQ